jgi:hypothetical protein
MWPDGRSGARGGPAPQPARRTLSAHHPGMPFEADDDSGLPRPLASVVPGPPLGREVSNIRRTRRMVPRWDLPRGVKHPADFHNDASQRNCKRYVSDSPLR